MILIRKKPCIRNIAPDILVEEIAIMIETIARNLPVEQIKFLQTVLSMVIEEKNEDPSATAQQLTN